MKYTIELTTTERDIICDLIRVYRDFGSGKHGIPFKNTTLCKFDEESTDYNLAYNKALKDMNHAMAVINAMTGAECAELFEGCIGVTRVFCEFTVEHIIKVIKTYEEKKKAEDEIRVGDEVISLSSGIKAVVTMVDDETVFVVYSDGSCGDFDKENFKKTGRTIKEVIQSLDELRGVKSEE